MKKNNILGIKSRTNKQIVGAGFTLAGGMLAGPLIKFKKLRHYRYKEPKKEEYK
jgi:hypothetical protein